jgi:hypothetical protein
MPVIRTPRPRLIPAVERSQRAELESRDALATAIGPASPTAGHPSSYDADAVYYLVAAPLRHERPSPEAEPLVCSVSWELRHPVSLALRFTRIVLAKQECR